MNLQPIYDDSDDRQVFPDSPEFGEWVEFINSYPDIKAEIKMRIDDVYAVYKAYEDRIDFLKEEAEIEGISFNKESESDFWSFIKSIPFIRKGSLFLKDNGNLRVVWKDDNGNHFGLEFFGNDGMQYVIFKRRAEEEIARVVGRDNQQGIIDKIHTYGLNSLVQS